MKNKIVIIIVALVLFACKKEDNKVVEQTTVEQTAPTSDTVPQVDCYLAVTESRNEGKVTNDTLMLSYERTGDSIYGEFNWLPYYKDKKTGTFSGTVKNHTAHTVLTASGEGITNKEEFLFSIAADKISVKMGEMAEGKDGIWHYKDATTASETIIPKVDCR